MNIEWSDEAFEKKYTEMETKLKDRIKELESLVDSLYEKIRNTKEGEWQKVVEDERVMCDCDDNSCYKTMEFNAFGITLCTDVTDPHYYEEIHFDLPENYALFKKVDK